MNFGKFFRLNWETSHLESGVAVFDYTGLTAHGESSERYSMSPKYPVSLTFSATSVKFLLHYGAFKSTKAEANPPQYAFEVNDIGNSKEVSIAHMEEVIIELPFAGKGSESLSSVIKRLYESEFPLRTKYGNQFLVKRLEETEEEAKKYRSHAYSSLKCMGSEGEWRPLSLYVLNNNKEQYTGFLRKLMLDFMFDLQHSDIFQSSGYFHAMYTGLMSNFYFSALLHKCEFYFYRQLLWDERKDQADKKELQSQDKKKQKDKKEQEEKREILYLDYKREAERLWVKDITSPQAELEFNYDGKKTEWFSDPETEMQEVCFPSQEKNGNKKVCRKMGPEQEHRVSISQWLMSRYDFKDVYQFHAPAWISGISGKVKKHTNGIIIGLLVIFILLPGLFLFPSVTTEFPIYGILGFIVVALIVIVIKYLRKIFGKKRTEEGISLSNNLHLFFPRLVAAIATAWITLALGFDLWVSFFDTSVYWIVIVIIAAVLCFFVLAKINQVTPHIGFFKKLSRSMEFIIIGYCISFAIGVVMVNYLGKPFMERGGYIQDFYAQLEDNKKLKYEGEDFARFIAKDGNEPQASLREMAEGLTNVYHLNKDKTIDKNHPVAKNVKFQYPYFNKSEKTISWEEIGCLKEHDIFYLRDFTVMFSFMALFIGIFIELSILSDRRQMTEL